MHGLAFAFHRGSLLTLIQVIAVKPESCPCGQTKFSDTAPYSIQQVIELPEIQMAITHVVLHETRCPRCGYFLKAALPVEYHYGYRPQLIALIGELSGPPRDSRSEAEVFCTSVLGVSISRGAIQRAVDQVSEASQPHDEAIAGNARRATVNYINGLAQGLEDMAQARRPCIPKAHAVVRQRHFARPRDVPAADQPHV